MIRRIVILVIIVLAVLGILYAWKNMGLSDKVIGSNEKADVSSYYGLTDDSSMIVTVNNERSEEIGMMSGGEAYIPIHTVQTQISNRFFWDGDEKVLRLVTPDEVVSTQALDTNAYTIGKEEKTLEHPIAIAGSDTIYLSMEFINTFADIHYTEGTEPNRICVSTEWGDLSYVALARNTSLREKGGRKSPVITTLDKGSLVVVTEEFDNWVGVTTEDGLTGYIQKSDLGEEKTKTFTSEKEEEVFSHILRDEKICLAWHQVTNEVANTYLSDVLSGTQGINVISPTWFYLNGNDGSIASLCSAEYVTACHEQGIEVWGLVSNLENPNVDTAIVLNRTSTRDTLINNLIGAAIQYDLDGINVDFEALNDKVGFSYIEFIRELSIKCEKNDLVLSVDNYPPSSFTQLYFRDEQAKFADYVILMAYDEHFSGSEEAGSVASLPYVKESVANTLEEVPAEQLILGVPFYTRLWKTTTTVDAESAGQADSTAAGDAAADAETDDGISVVADGETGDDADAASGDGTDTSASADGVVTEEETVVDSEAGWTSTASANVTCENLGMADARKNLSENQATQTWLDEECQYYAEYEKDGARYQIWLEEEKSISEKLNIMRENNLAGAAFWKLSYEDSNIWKTITGYLTQNENTAGDN